MKQTPNPVASGQPGTTRRSHTNGRRQRLCLRTLACALAGLMPAIASADSVTEWNQIADATTAIPLPMKLRAMAMTHIAIHDALNAIDPRYRSYSIAPTANLHASPDAAVATAARDVLVSTVPAQAATVNGLYADFMAALPPCPAAHPRCLRYGVLAGRGAAHAILAARVGDHADAPQFPYTRAPAPGVHQPTPTTSWDQLSTPMFESWAGVTPFALRRRDQFRAQPSRLFDLRSPTYTFDYLEVKYLGSAQARGGAHADSEMSRIARFWYGSGSNWFPTARAIAARHDLDQWQNARLFALLAISQVDVTISVFDSKYHYDFWRPVTAINWINDGNPYTRPQPGWLPYLVTPPYPDYPCGVPMLAGAGTEVLRRFFGTDYVPYTVTARFAAQGNIPADEITRRYWLLSQAAAEAASARVYAGIHFRTGCRVGVGLGEKVGRFAYRHYLQPLHGHKGRSPRP